MGLWIPETASVLVFILKNVPKHFSLSQKDTVCQQMQAVYISVVLNYYTRSNVTRMTNADDFVFLKSRWRIQNMTRAHIWW